MSSSDTYTRGYDIVAVKDGKMLYIEAKGAPAVTEASVIPFPKYSYPEYTL